MSDVVSQVGIALKDAFLMAWEVWWALVLGFFISAVVQAWVPRERIEARLAGGGPRPLAWATGLGAASSSCSYAAIAIAKSLFQKGASASAAIAFQFASTNLVWELGLVLWVLIGWQFTLAEYLGGLVMIVLMGLLVRVFISPGLEEAARAHARQAGSGCGGASGSRRCPRGRMSPTTSAATGRCSTARSQAGSSWPGSSACSETRPSTLSSCMTPPSRCPRSKT
jgi:uncharacterized membrane protein YraQ (UPF0718 family)